MPRSAADPAAQGTASRGRAFVYVLPCFGEGQLKLGFSRDPLQRMQALHARYFDFFDLDGGFLLETDSVREARALERALAAEVAAHSAPAPLTARAAAAGLTEWYRGAYEALWQAVQARAAQGGYPLHAPLRPWLRQALLARADRLYSWCERTFEALPHLPAGALPAADVQRAMRQLRSAIDAYAAVELDARAWVSPAVWRWYAGDGEA